MRKWKCHKFWQIFIKKEKIWNSSLLHFLFYFFLPFVTSGLRGEGKLILVIRGGEAPKPLAETQISQKTTKQPKFLKTAKILQIKLIKKGANLYAICYKLYASYSDMLNLESLLERWAAGKLESMIKRTK